MKKITFWTIFVLLVVLAGPAVVMSAPPGPPEPYVAPVEVTNTPLPVNLSTVYRFVGFSAQQVNTQKGVGRMHEACQGSPFSNTLLNHLK